MKTTKGNLSLRACAHMNPALQGSITEAAIVSVG